MEHFSRFRATECQICGSNLDTIEASNWEARQAQDIAPMQLCVTKHQVKVKCCLRCQTLDRAALQSK